MTPDKKAQPVQFNLHRHGEFSVEVFGANHCSLKPGKNILKYNLTISCIHLDDRGFVFVQEDLSSFFDGIEDVTLSCEQLALRSALEIRKMVCENLKTENVRVSVRISPPPYMGAAEAVVGELKRTNGKKATTH